MKTSILLFVFVCAFTLTISASPKQGQTAPHIYKHPLLELYKKFHSGHSNISQSKQTPDSQFILNSVEHQGWDGDDFSSYYKVDHIYQSGRRAESRHSYRMSIEAEWQTTSREVYHYEGSRLISIVNQINTGQGYLNDYRTLITYQISGNQYFISELIDQYWASDNSDWVNDERVALIISNGKLSIGESSSWDGDDWYTYELFFLEEQGDDLYVTYQEPYGPYSQNWRYTERQVFNNYTINDLYNFFLEDINMIDTGAYLSYTELLPDYTGQSWAGADWLDVERQVTEVDYNWQTGKMIYKKISGQIFDDEWITNTEVRISYEDGIKSEMALYLFENDELDSLSPIYAEKFEYNELGLVHYIVQMQGPGVFQKTAEKSELDIIGRLMLQWGGVSTSIEHQAVPIAFSLGNAYPNPFNPSTVIPFEAQIAGEISIRVYDMLGRHVATLANGVFPAGRHSVHFDASGLSSGVYLVRMTAAEMQQVRRVTLLK